MSMSQQDIFTKVQGVLVDALGVDDDEVTPTARLTTDLHAESIDFLDIVFRIEKACCVDNAVGDILGVVDVVGKQFALSNLESEGLLDAKDDVEKVD